MAALTRVSSIAVGGNIYYLSTRLPRFARSTAVPLAGEDAAAAAADRWSAQCAKLRRPKYRRRRRRRPHSAPPQLIRAGCTAASVSLVGGSARWGNNTISCGDRWTRSPDAAAPTRRHCASRDARAAPVRCPDSFRHSWHSTNRARVRVYQLNTVRKN